MSPRPPDTRARSAAPARPRAWPARWGALVAAALVAAVAVASSGAGRTGGARALPADADGDDIADAGDACPHDPGLAPDGCPPRDSDGDGVLDRADPCPDRAGPVANQGCPDLDRDGDGVVDRRDLCPDQRGHADAAGCQIPDRDGDAIADVEDACPDRAEVWNGRRDRDGCPDAGKPLLAVHAGRIELAPARWFRGSGRLSSAGRAAVAVAVDALLAAQARRVRIEVTAGRTSSNRGDAGDGAARAQAEQLGRALSAAHPGLRIELAPGHEGQPLVVLVFD